MKQKSKQDIADQITRIYQNYGQENPRYMMALGLSMAYIQRMSNTEKNKALHREFMGCFYSSGIIRPGKEELSKSLLHDMINTKYPASVYAESGRD